MMMKTHIAEAADRGVRSAGDGGVLSLLVSSLVSMANDPTNTKFFFPSFLQTVKLSGGQSLVPFTTEINMGRPDALRPLAQTACRAWAANYGYSSDAEPADAPLIDITQATFSGLNNARISSYQIDPPTSDVRYPVIFTAELNYYPQYSNLSVNQGQFSFDVTCQTTDQQHSEDLPAQGTFDAQFTSPLFSLVLLLAFNDDLTVTVEIPESYTPASSGTIPGIQLSFGSGGRLTVSNVKVNENDPVLRTLIDNLLRGAFAQASTTTQIVTLFNQRISSSDVRSAVASAMQAQINNLLSSLR